MPSYLGCYADQNVRLLNRAFVDENTTMAVDVCEDYCSNYSEKSYYPLFGLENGSQCYCGSNFTQKEPEQVEDHWCGTSCAGNSTQICGGYWFISVYNITSAPSGKSPAPAKTITSTRTSATKPTRASLISTAAPTTTPALTSTSSSSSTTSSSSPTQDVSNGLATTSSFSASVAKPPSPLVPKTTVIAIGVVAALFAVALFGVIVYLLFFRRKWRKHLEAQQEKEIASTMDISKGSKGNRSSPVEMWVSPAEMPAGKSSPSSPRVTLPSIPPQSPSINRGSIKTMWHPFVSDHYDKNYKY